LKPAHLKEKNLERGVPKQSAANSLAGNFKDGEMTVNWSRHIYLSPPDSSVADPDPNGKMV
jgi:hypothetical protein